jgi:hypothetical protein
MTLYGYQCFEAPTDEIRRFSSPAGRTVPASALPSEAIITLGKNTPITFSISSSLDLNLC